MSKMSTDPVRHALSGPTMGTRWSALFWAEPGFDVARIRSGLQAAVDEVDAQMSIWKTDSALMLLNRAPIGAAVPIPAMLEQVLQLGVAIGKASGGAFDMGVGDAVSAWGFGPGSASQDSIRAAMSARRVSAVEALAFGQGTVTKRTAIMLDLNGIAKGVGVDRLAESLSAFGVRDALVGIDGEMRAMGHRPDAQPWTVAVEKPDPDRRAPHSVLALTNCAVATSGDYRHFVTVDGRRLSHTIDPKRGAPLLQPPASVTVIAPSCAVADAWATALMVLGPAEGSALARKIGLEALFLLCDERDTVRARGVGNSFVHAA
ncbi:MULTISPECIES: FAD:protein FMN transferase [Hyphomicrobiales]|uniref:FAD:protein FMN transferase n=1 Tax=Aminobacter ciceronei TaxID=150723 RepID=A0ABR6C9X4_9HYPH|nr:FAD:protein FMN transferase [Aminobacter ciceronei]MBA8907919.1 thiamine biosynthesis lipoprotein [Aminobacter ciceronei]MBA9021820.1 thiamine biosynthesis lipoprotein [Aminobacter ciceronei]